MRGHPSPLYTVRSHEARLPSGERKDSVKNVKIRGRWETYRGIPVPFHLHLNKVIETAMYRIMTAKRICTGLLGLLAACVAGPALLASEYHGTVTAVGLPVPGATITAVQGDRRMVTTTDDKGIFSFTELPDGPWTITVEMTGFDKALREVTVSSSEPAGSWVLKFLPVQTSGPGIQRQAAPEDGRQFAERGRGSGASPATLPLGGAFSRLDVNEAPDSTVFLTEGVLRNEEVADLNRSAANSLIVQGSISSALARMFHTESGLAAKG